MEQNYGCKADAMLYVSNLGLMRLGLGEHCKSSSS